MGHQMARTGLDFDDINCENNFNSRMVYAKSKLANILHAKELARRLENTGISVYVLHPGEIKNSSCLFFFCRVSQRILPVVFLENASTFQHEKICLILLGSPYVWKRSILLIRSQLIKGANFFLT